MNNRRNIAKFKPLVLAGMLAGLAGCSLFRKPQPMQIPSGLEDFPGIFELKTGPKKAEALQKVFPPIKEYIMSGDVLAERRKFFFFRAKSLMRLSLISGGDRKIRMAGRH
ncbi:hypothetical protein HYR69_12225, partial [Candidatus Sumerlaeota bacterium]|nr:hypothetical protein [Candidatus Sumerlaeota bacterium]